MAPPRPTEADLRTATEAWRRDRRRAAGLAVRDHRREHGLTQAWLATAAGVSVTLVSLVERGRHAAAWATLNRLAAALEIDVSKLATGSA